MFAAAIELAGSTDPLRVAYALEGLRLQGNMGEVWMRPDDHQLLEPLFVVRLTRVNGRDVKYGLEGTQTGTRTLPGSRRPNRGADTMRNEAPAAAVAVLAGAKCD